MFLATKPLQKAAHLCSLQPHYDAANVALPCILCKMNAIIKIITITTAYLSSINVDEDLYGDHGAVLAAIERALCTCVAVLGVTEVSFGDMERWSEYAKDLKCVARFLGVAKRSKGQKVIVGICLYFIVFIFAFGGVWDLGRGVEEVFCRLVYIACVWYEIGLIGVYTWNVLVVKRIYEDVMGYLVANLHSKSIAALTVLEQATRICHIAKDLTKKLNEIYGVILIFIFTHVTTYGLKITHPLIYHLNIYLRFGYDINTLILTATSLILLTIPLFVMCIACDITNGSAMEVVTLCQRLKLAFRWQTPERKEIGRLIKMMETDCSKFSATGIINVDRWMLYWFCSSVFVYFFIVFAYSSLE